MLFLLLLSLLSNNNSNNNNKHFYTPSNFLISNKCKLNMYCKFLVTFVLTVVACSSAVASEQLNCSVGQPFSLKIKKVNVPQKDAVVWDVLTICHDTKSCYGPEFNVQLDMLPQVIPFFTQFNNNLISFTSPSSGMTYYRTDENGFKFCNFDRQNIVPNINNVPVSLGRNYFIASSSTSPWLSCQGGQRLNVTVLADDCKFQPASLTFCNGMGLCAARTWEEMFTCKCCRPNYGQYCEMVDGCHWYKDDCENGGWCVDELNDQMDKTLYNCKCPHGYSGSRCEQQDNPQCSRNECKNGGTCLVTEANVYGFMCHCPDGYQGVTCEVQVDNCASNPCFNNGLCVNGVGTFTCICADGFAGSYCQSDLRVCRADTCQHGGTCQVVNGTATCACPIEYTGVMCSESRNLCSPSPCKHALECSFNSRTYTCICIVGYTGRDCEINIDDCASNPCGSQGTCVDGVASYRCHCLGDTVGSSCPEPADVNQTAQSSKETNANELNNTSSSSNNPALSVLGIIFIILVSLAIIICLIGGGWYLMRKRRRRQYVEQINDTNSMSMKDRINTTSAFPGELFGDDTYPESIPDVSFSSSSSVSDTPLVQRRKKASKI
ncbi:hypothetical protein HELRODRAFT_109631 [Helobdella robusta]|uniref:EGF-like domain-containing protein n=1 Tax=Helobdella robusta TaxID=6412 RepID=T1EEV3_HELRO|nr:hypothetical protein HELRODRAFT_109631 [Helobdella robusta]ESO09362.1 hypothetical protein HELRODRAFT_109631 [Helobdella robusta]